jgi:hypothetical protein
MDEDEIKDEDKEEEDKEPEADGPDPAKIVETDDEPDEPEPTEESDEEDLFGEDPLRKSDPREISLDEAQDEEEMEASSEDSMDDLDLW